MIGVSHGLETDNVGEALGGGGQRGRGVGYSGHLEAWQSVLTPDLYRWRWGKADTSVGVQVFVAFRESASLHGST